MPGSKGGATTAAAKTIRGAEMNGRRVRVGLERRCADLYEARSLRLSRTLMGLGAMYDGVRKPRMGREEETMS